MSTTSPNGILPLRDKHGKRVLCPMCDHREVHILLFGGNTFVVECVNGCHRTEPARKEETARKRWFLWVDSYENEEAGVDAGHSHAKLQEATISRLEKLQASQQAAVLLAATQQPAPDAPGEGNTPPALLPCPYCGGKPTFEFSDGDHSGRGMGYYIHCPMCWARGPVCDPKAPWGHYHRWNEVAARVSSSGAAGGSGGSGGAAGSFTTADKQLAALQLFLGGVAGGSGGVADGTMRISGADFVGQDGVAGGDSRGRGMGHYKKGGKQP